MGLSQYEETQQLKVEEKGLHKKTACLANRPTTAFTCSKCDRDCHSRTGLHSHKDAAKWVQIYGLLRPTDANDDECNYYVFRSLFRLAYGTCVPY